MLRAIAMRWAFRLPPGLPASLIDPVAQPVLELVRRYARTHGPFTLREVADRFALDAAVIENTLRQLAVEGRVLEGGFRPGGLQHPVGYTSSAGGPGCIASGATRRSCGRFGANRWPSCAAKSSRLSSTRWRAFFTHWQGLLSPRRSSHAHLDALLDAIESLQGAPIPASLLETSILPARVAGYEPAGLDTLIAAGEVTWAGIDPIGERDGRIALFLADKLPLLAQQRPLTEPLTEREEKLLAVLESTGASFFDPLHQAVGGGYPGESIDALWSLVWRGLVTNDSLHALRAYITRPESARVRSAACIREWSFARGAPRRRTRKAAGRCCLCVRERELTAAPSNTEASHALALQLLNRYGVLTREAVGCRKHSRRIQRRLRRAEGAGRERPHSPRILCRRARALRNLRCPPRSICCGNCAPNRLPRSRSSSSWPRPIRRIPMARSCAGPICR